MQTSILSLVKAGFRATAVTLVSASIGTGCASAETYRHGGSTATIEQRGGTGPSEAEVTRYPNGQKIITRDGSSTDITIQRDDGSAPGDPGLEPPETSVDRFDDRLLEERFSHIEPYDEPDNQAGTDCYECRPSWASEEFKRRMFERMDPDLLP